MGVLDLFGLRKRERRRPPLNLERLEQRILLGGLGATVERVSVAWDAAEGDDNSSWPSVSADGRYVAFESDASNLVLGDTNATRDVFVYDRLTDALERVSVASDGTQANNHSQFPSASADGRYVAFRSLASNLVPGDTNSAYDIFVYDRSATGGNTIERVSVASDGTQSDYHSHSPSISSDGRYVGFTCGYSLVPGDTNGAVDVFVHDRDTDTTERVSVATDGTEGNGANFDPSLSSDGRYVAFHSEASNLVAGDTNGALDVFVYDRDSNSIERVSVASDGTEGNNYSSEPSISADGRYVAFRSYAVNLVPGDTNGASDIFVYDRSATGGDAIERVSVASDGTESNDYSHGPSMSADGRYVGFYSYAANLVPGDTNVASDIFVHDRWTSAIERVSVASDGTQGNGGSYLPSISADGRYVAFESTASSLVPDDTNAVRDIFVYDRWPVIDRVSVASDGTDGNQHSFEPSVSDDGRYVAFWSSATNLVPGDTNGAQDVFVYDRQTSAIERVSVAADGTEGNNHSYGPSISADGRYVAFMSGASNLVPGDTNGVYDVFVHDRDTDTIERVSVASDGTEGNKNSGHSAISADGRYVAFYSEATNLVPGDTNGEYDIFVYDRQASTIERVSVASDGTEGNGYSSYTSISDDGRYVAFESGASNLVPGDTNGVRDVFVYDRQTSAVERVSVASDGTEANALSGPGDPPAISADGRYVAFHSDATNLVPGDTNGVRDMFVYDRQTDSIERVSVASDGTEADNVSRDPSISADGRYVAFCSRATNLVPEDTNGTFDIFVYDRSATGGDTIERVSVDSDGTEGSGGSYDSFIRADGRYVAFSSQASNLVPGDTNAVSDVFVYDRLAADVPPDIALDEPLPGVVVQGGGIYTVRWTDADPDHDAQISLYWDVDADAANNLPGDEGTAWGVIATGISEDDAADSFDWLVGAPGGGDYYLHAVIDDGLATAQYYTANAFHVLPGNIERVSVASDGTEASADTYYPAISADGRYVAFESVASNLVPGDTNSAWDVFVYDRVTDSVERVSVASDGTEGNSWSGYPSISADGRYVAFWSEAYNLVPADTNGVDDIFVYDRQTGTIERVSVAADGTEGNGDSGTPFISADGRYVAFESGASNLVPGDTNGSYDIFVYDRSATGGNTIERVSVASDGTESNGWSEYPSISGDGRYVAFDSTASNLVSGDTNGAMDIFVYDRQTETIERVSVASDGTEGNGNSHAPSISADGRYVAFYSLAANLVPGDTNATWDIFVYDRQMSTIERVSVASDGTEANASSGQPSISADGRYVAFYSWASNLLPGDTNGAVDVFVYDRQAGSIERVSVASDGTEANDWSADPCISADGRYVAFYSEASNLVPGDTNGVRDVFVYDRLAADVPPDIALDDPAPGTVVGLGDIYTISWTDSDSDDDAQISLYWDLDTDPANNLAGNEGVTWGVIATGISEDDPADSYDWTVDAPAGRDYYLYGFMDDGLATDEDHTAQVLHVTGVRIFGAPTVYATADPHCVTAADFDGDGHMDLAAANRVVGGGLLPPNIVVFLNNGDGTFAAATSYDLPSDAAALTVADFNGDGYPDLALATDELSVLLNNGDGTFGPVTNHGVTALAHSIVASDLDGDGNVDLAVVNFGPDNIGVWLGAGNGTFGAGVYYATSRDPQSVTAADFNGDGYPDLAVANEDYGDVSVLLNNGDGTFAPATNFVAGGYLYSITASDFDGDGNVDLAVAGGYVRVLMGAGDGTFGAAAVYAAGNYPRSVTAADFDGDGWPDLASANSYSDDVSVLLNNGDGTFGTTVNYAAGNFPVSVTASDFNGDGLPDLAVANSTANNIAVLLNGMPRIVLDDPAPGTLLNVGANHTITWTDSDADDDAQISLFWDVDTDRGNNAPADEDITWGIIATGISEDDPADAFDWLVDAPQGGDYYLYGYIDDGLAAGEDYTADSLHVNPPIIERVSVASDGTEGNHWSEFPAISGDGRYVAFASWATNLVPEDTNDVYDVFVYDRSATGGDTIERVSVASDGTEANEESWSLPSISADGRYVAFASGASNLVPGDTNATWDIFVYDLQTGTIERVSMASDGSESNDGSDVPAISADGRYVAFQSWASNLVPGDTNGLVDVFVYDRQTSTIERVSVAWDGTESNEASYAPSVSADGRYVAFWSGASNLVPGDTNGVDDILVYDRQTGSIERVSVASDGTEGNHRSYEASISADGRYVAFRSGASNLVPGDTNYHYDIFVYDRDTDSIERVSVASDGTEGNNYSYDASISADGRYVAFRSCASNLVPGDTAGKWDIFVHDRETGAIERVSVASDGSEANSSSYGPSISGDGRYVAFRSGASNLVPGDTNGTSDIFVYDRLAGLSAADLVQHIAIAQVWDYDYPSDPLSYEIEIEVTTDAAVQRIGFTTPAGNTYEITQEPYEAGGIETWYGSDGQTAWWEFGGSFSDSEALDDYGDGEYTITVHYLGDQVETTVWFGIPGTPNPIPQVTQQPVITGPAPVALVASPVMFAWEECTDPVAAYLWIDVENAEGEVAEKLPLGATSHGPVELAPGLWEVAVEFEHGYDGTNDDGIPFRVRTYSQSDVPFSVVAPLVQYEVYGSSTFDPGQEWGWWDLQDNPGSYGFELLGAAYGTDTFAGSYDYYLVLGADRPAASAVIDAIVGSDAASFALDETFGVAYPELAADVDARFAVLGAEGPGGFFLLDATGRSLDSITVTVPELSQSFVIPFVFDTEGNDTRAEALVLPSNGSEGAVLGWLDAQEDADYYSFTAAAGDTINVMALPAYRPFEIGDIQFLNDGRLLLNCERDLSTHADLVALNPATGELSVLVSARQFHDAGIGREEWVAQLPDGRLRFVNSGPIVDYLDGSFDFIYSMVEQYEAFGEFIVDEAFAPTADGRIFGDWWVSDAEVAVVVLMLDGTVEVVVPAADLAAAGVGGADYIDKTFFDEDTEDLYLLVAQEGDEPQPGRILRVDSSTGAISTYLSQAQLQGYFGAQTVDIGNGVMDQEGSFYFCPNLETWEEQYDSIFRFNGSSFDVWVTHQQLNEGLFEGVFGHVELAIDNSGDVYVLKGHWQAGTEIALLGNAYTGAAPELVMGESAWAAFSALSGQYLDVTLMDAAEDEIAPTAPGSYDIGTTGDYYLRVTLGEPALLGGTLEYRVLLSGVPAQAPVVTGLALTEVFLYGLETAMEAMAGVRTALTPDEPTLYLGTELPWWELSSELQRAIVGISLPQLQALSLFDSHEWPEGVAVVPAENLADRTIFVGEDDWIASVSAVDGRLIDMFEVQALFGEGLCAASDGSVYAARWETGVDRFTLDGTLIRQFRHADLQFPVGAALSPLETTLYVSDLSANEIFVFDVTDGSLVERFSVPTVQGLAHVALDLNGTLYVTDHITNRVLRWDRSTGELAEAALPGILAGTITTLPDGSVGAMSEYVAAPWIIPPEAFSPIDVTPQITLDDPAPDTVVGLGDTYTITWTDSDADDDAQVSLHWDMDADPANNLAGNEGVTWGTIATGISEDDPADSYDWTVDALAGRDYYLYGVIDDGLTTDEDHTASSLRVTAWAVIRRVSVTSDGTEPDADSSRFYQSISDDGRYVAFDTYATNLVSGDTNGECDVFVRDLQTGAIERVSLASDGTEGNGRSYHSEISADGRYVAFQSLATNLVAGDTNGYWDIFVYDRQTDTIERVSVASDGTEANMESYYPSISADGRYVAFQSYANNLVPGDTNGATDIFVYDRSATGGDAIERVSLASGGTQVSGHSSRAAISADGRYVAFQSWSAGLAAGTTGTYTDVFVYDRQTATVEWASAAWDGAIGNGSSWYSAISPEGRYVAFESLASNLLPGDTNGEPDIFVYNLQMETIERVSLASDGTEGDGGSYRSSISADGRYVAFMSVATNLVPGDTNGFTDVFVHDRSAAGGDVIERVSVASDGTEADGASGVSYFGPAISADGRYVAFDSDATNLVPGDTNAARDVFVYDRTPVIERVSVASDGAEANSYSSDASISADGRYVALESFASNLVPGDTNGATDIFVHDRQTDTIERVSVAFDATEGNAGSVSPSISADGRYVAFHSYATNLVPGDTNGVRDIFVYDRQTATIERVSVASDGTEGNDGSQLACISPDGRYVAFNSQATNLVPGDTNGVRDIFVYDRQTSAIERVSVASDGTEGNGNSVIPSMSADGRYVAFQSVATNLVPGDTNGTDDVFVYDRLTDVIERVSVAADGTEANDESESPAISADGRYVAFRSDASNLVPGDTNAVGDVFVYDRQTDTIERVSVASDGTEGNGRSGYVSISADGWYVAFESDATNLVPGDTNGLYDIFVYDRQTSTTQRVSVAWDAAEGNGQSWWGAISADGRYVAFPSYASNLVPGDTNGMYDVFVYDCWRADAPPDITLDDPAPGIAVNPGDVHAVTWTDSDPNNDARIFLFWDADTVPGNNLPADEGTTWGIIARGISEDDTANSFDWTLDAPAGGEYYLYGYTDDGLAADVDYTADTVRANVVTEITLDEPAPGTVVSSGGIHTITWTDYDPDDNAQISLFWDADTDQANNLAGNEGVTWGVIATGINEDDSLDSFDWAVDAPTGGDYYLYALIDDGSASAVDYTGNTLYVNVPPTVGGLSDVPDTVAIGDDLLLTAVGVADPDGFVVLVEFYRDADGNSTWDPGYDQLLGSDTAGGDGWSWQGTVTWAAGMSYTYFARAQDNEGAWGAVVSTIGEVGERPVVASLTDAPDPVARGEALTLTALGVTDPDGVVVRVDFYRGAVVNGPPASPSDVLLGSDTDGADGWSWSGTATWAAETHTYFACAEDNDGAVSAPATTTGTVTALPAITLHDPPPGTVVGWGDMHAITWSDYGPDDDAQISLFWDADTDPGNNLPADDGVTWGTIATGISEDDLADSFGWAVDAPLGGDYYLYAYIEGALGAGEDYTAESLRVNVPPEITLDDPSAGTVVSVGDAYAITWTDSDPDHDALISLFWDVDTVAGNNLPGNEGVTWGTIAVALSEDDPADAFDWIVDAAPGGEYYLYAYIDDGLAADEDFTATSVFVNASPQITLDEPPAGTAVSVGSVYTITWTDSDPDHDATISLYWDSDTDPANNAAGLQGTSWGVIAAGISEDDPADSYDWTVDAPEGGVYHLYAHIDDGLATDEDYTANTLAMNIPPEITLGDPVAGTVANVGDVYAITWTDYDPDDNAQISLFWDVDNVAGNNAPSNEGVTWGTIATGISEGDPGDSFAWTVNAPAGSAYYLCGLIEDVWASDEGYAANPLHVNAPPTVGGLSDAPDPVAVGGQLLLTAAGVADPDGAVVLVEFYRDADGNGTWDGAIDALLGSDADGADGWSWPGTVTWSAGIHTYFARVQDDYGAWSGPVSTTNRVNEPPLIALYEPLAGAVVRPGDAYTIAWNDYDPDDSAQISLGWDIDTDPVNNDAGLHGTTWGIIVVGISEDVPTDSYDWTVDAPSGGQYHLYALISDVLETDEDYTFNTVAVDIPPQIALGDPAVGTVVTVGDVYAISWTDADPDNDAQISLYWDLDTNSGNNLPFNEGVTWGTIATGISEDDPADAFDWPVYAPAGADCYLYASINDGLVTSEDYTGNSLLVRAAATERVSMTSERGDGNSGSYAPAVSGDGRYVAFVSESSNLVPGDTNGKWDIFVYDRQTYSIERVSVAFDGAQANGHSQYPAISTDGRFVAFMSYASNLVPGDANSSADIFVYDRQAGAIERVSVASDGTEADSDSCYWPSISADGRYVAFMSYAANLVPGDTNDEADVFVYDRQASSIERVSMAWDGGQANRRSSGPAISADGQYVAFMSYATNLVPGDANGAWDIFVYDRQTAAVELLSAAPDGTSGDGDSYWPSISADGRYVAFQSSASDLAAGDANGQGDIFVYDRQAAVVELVSMASDGTQGDAGSDRPAISADGQYVAFVSGATSLVPGDTNGSADVFVRDRQAGVTELVSVASDGTQGNADSYRPAISADGQYVAFASDAANLVQADTNGCRDVFLYDSSGGGAPHIALSSPAPGTVVKAGETYDVIWSNCDPDDDAQIALYWDVDTDPGNNLPGGEGVTWGTIAAGISEDDPADLFAWTVDAPAGSDCYLYAVIDDGVTIDTDYTETAFSVGGFALLGFRLVDGALVSVYDVDPSNGLSDPVIAWSRAGFVRGVTDVVVHPGRIGDGRIAYIALYGDGTETADLGFVVEGNTALGKFRDLRTDAPPLGFLVSEGDVRSISLRAGIAGADLNGFTTEGGWALAADIDGQGGTADLVGVYTAGRIGSLFARNDIDGGVIASGGMKTLRVRGGDLNGDVVTGGGLRCVYASGDLTGDIIVTGDLGRVTVRGNIVGSTIRVVSGGFKALRVGRNMDVNGVLIDVDGVFRKLNLGGDFHNSSIYAGALGRVLVRGQITEDATDGEDEIVAEAGRFLIRDADDYDRISVTHEHDFAGVRACVQ